MRFLKGMSMTHKVWGDTVLDGLNPSWPTSPRECVRKARVCNRLAKLKLFTGQLRRKLYRLKNRNIRAAFEINQEALSVRVDNDRYFGLLSVALKADPDERLHTHENWLGTA